VTIFTSKDGLQHDMSEVG